MNTEEFVKITEDSIRNLLVERYGYTEDGHDDTRRRRPRWPFDAPVELWVPDWDGGQEHAFGTTLNLSPNGLAVLTDFPLEVSVHVPIAVHQPEASYHGEAVVRHCAEVEDGFRIGLEFVF